MVGNTLVVRQQVRQDEARPDRAFAELQALDVRALGLRDQNVNDLLQRLDVDRQRAVGFAEGADRHFQNLVHRVRQVADLRLRVLGEGDLLLLDLLRALEQIDRVVAQTLEVADRVQHERHPAGVDVGDGAGRQLD